MFDFVRSHTKLLQFILVLLIFPSFVVFGIQGYSRFTDGANATVAKVGGHEIKQSELDSAHRVQVERMRAQMPTMDIKLFDTPEARRQTLDSLIRDQLLLTAAAKENLRVTDAQLISTLNKMPELAPVRDASGNIDKAQYKAFLVARGLSDQAFEADVQQGLLRQQVMAGVTGSTLEGKTATKTTLDALLERREVQLQRFDAKNYLAKLSPSDADIEAYYKQNQPQFHTNEEARIEYVVLDLESLKKQLSLSDSELQTYYKENIKRYTSAEERHAAHILIKVDAKASPDDKAKAKAKAEALLAEARKNPAGFAELAKKNSQDEGSAPNGGDLDFFGRGAMVKSFEDAAFSMKPGEISNLVESEFGFHIIKLLGTRGGEVRPYEAVREQIVDEVSKPLAQKKYAEVAEQFTNMVYEQPDSLQPVVDKLKLAKVEATVQRTPAPAVKGPLASAKLLEAVFGSESVKSKHNTEAIETGANQLVSARVIEYHPERVLPLAEVRDRVLERVRAQQAAAAAKKEGEARVAAVKQNAADALPQVLTISRAQPQGQPRQVIDAALRADIGKGPTAVGVDLGDQGFVAVKVIKRVDRDANDPDNERAGTYVVQSLSSAESFAYYEALKRRFKVDVKLQPVVAEEAASAASK